MKRKPITRSGVLPLFLALSILLALCSALVPVALADQTEWIDEASYISELQEADFFVQAKLLSLSPYDENIAADCSIPFRLSLSVEKGLYGKAPDEKRLDFILDMPPDNGLTPGQSYVFALKTFSAAERKKIASSGIDLGPYGVAGILQMEKEGALKGLLSGNNFSFSSFQDLQYKIEGRLPAVGNWEERVLFYNGQRIYWAWVNTKTPVYEGRSEKAKQRLVLDVWDYVLVVGDEEAMQSGERDSQHWKKILLADGTLGHVPAHTLDQLAYFLYEDATLVAVPKSVYLRKLDGTAHKDIKLRKGTAFFLKDWAYPEDYPYMTALTQSGLSNLVPRADYAPVVLPPGASLTSIADSEIIEEDTLEYESYAENEEYTYRMNQSTGQMVFYAAPSSRAKVVCTLPPGAYFLQEGVNETLKKEGKRWIRVMTNTGAVYALDKNYRPQGDAVPDYNPYAPSRDTATYRLAKGQLKQEAAGIVCKDFVVSLYREASLEDGAYRQLRMTGDDTVWLQIETP